MGSHQPLARAEKWDISSVDTDDVDVEWCRCCVVRVLVLMLVLVLGRRVLRRCVVRLRASGRDAMVMDGWFVCRAYV